MAAHEIAMAGPLPLLRGDELRVCGERVLPCFTVSRKRIRDMPPTTSFIDWNEFVVAALIFLILIGAGEVGYLLARRRLAGKKNETLVRDHCHPCST